MIKVTAFYPDVEGGRFDIEYYCKRHMPMVRERVGTAIKRIEVELGLSGGVAGSQAGYRAMGHLYFESVEAFREAFAPHAAAIIGDIRNYTDIQPKVQISEVMPQGS